MSPWTTYDGTESPALKRYERTVDALSLFAASVRADGLSLADAFMRHLSDIDSDADIPPAATPPWRKFLADYAGVSDPAGFISPSVAPSLRHCPSTTPPRH